MSSILARLRKLLASRRASSLVEYSSLALLIAIAAIAVFTRFGTPGGGAP
jgi:Flp pilus assembly pilin Flp